jgi:hypothetical protein
MKTRVWISTAVFVLIAAAAVAQESAESTGSPAWFRADHFFEGWAVSWATVGTWFVYWFIKRSVNDAIE